ncbi:MAG: sugar phosphate isomerase/epimerase [Oscillospiraceae bacterium]|jgi:sugar phosphate isomerase/epimerase|nr:sugar phosphate isomerase/epimerase [Oscillospiraceae bacterium]
MPISVGAQLYSLRDCLQTPAGIEATLVRVAQAGCKILQCSGFSFDAVWLKALCDQLGLQVKLTHTPAERILHDTQNVIFEHKTLDCPYVGLGYWDFCCADDVHAFLKTFAPAMQALHSAGLKLQYHNHSHEFARCGEGTLFGLLADKSDPALLGFTLDVYWAQHGGMDVCALIRRLKGRIDVCHYKDMAIVQKQQRFAAVGKGNLPWPAIIEAFESAGARYAFVEQDDCYGADPVDELTDSLRYLREISPSR